MNIPTKIALPDSPTPWTVNPFDEEYISDANDKYVPLGWWQDGNFVARVVNEHSVMVDHITAQTAEIERLQKYIVLLERAAGQVIQGYRPTRVVGADEAFYPVDE